MKYYKKFGQYSLNEANNADNMVKALSNMDKAKKDENNNNKFGRHIANVLSNLNKLDAKNLTDDERTQFQTVVSSLQEIMKGKEEVVFTDTKPKRKQRYDAIVASIGDDGKVDINKATSDMQQMSDKFGDQEEIKRQEEADELDDKAQHTEETTPEENTPEETTPEETTPEETTPEETTPEETTDDSEALTSVKNTVPTFDKITKMDKLPYLSQKIWGTKDAEGKEIAPDEVKFVQALLKSKGLLEHNTIIEAVITGDDVSVDGKYGPGTAKGVKAFQEEQGLEADGVVGPGTWKALLKEVGVDKDIEGIKYDEYTKLEAPREADLEKIEPKDATEVSNKEDTVTEPPAEEPPAEGTATENKPAETKPKMQANAGAQGKELANREEAALGVKKDISVNFKNMNTRKFDGWLKNNTTFKIEQAAKGNKEYAEQFYNKMSSYLDDRIAARSKNASKYNNMYGNRDFAIGAYNAVKSVSGLKNNVSANIEKQLKKI